eukprot:7382652-Prymnesium_polylepis.1
MYEPFTQKRQVTCSSRKFLDVPAPRCRRAGIPDAAVGLPHSAEERAAPSSRRHGTVRPNARGSRDRRHELCGSAKTEHRQQVARGGSADGCGGRSARSCEPLRDHRLDRSRVWNRCAQEGDRPGAAGGVALLRPGDALVARGGEHVRRRRLGAARAQNHRHMLAARRRRSRERPSCGVRLPHHGAERRGRRARGSERVGLDGGLSTAPHLPQHSQAGRVRRLRGRLGAVHHAENVLVGTEGQA